VIATVISIPADGQRSRVQYGAAVEWRGQIGDGNENTDRRRGLAARVMANGPWFSQIGWVVDGAYSQMQYDRTDENGTLPINENGIELGGFLRHEFPRVKSARPYVIAGPVASFRMSCGIDSAFEATGFVDCENPTEFMIGWGVGAGARAGFVAGWDWFLETRVLGNVTSAAGGKLIAIGIGAAF
jgi:hypothetical protein